MFILPFLLYIYLHCLIKSLNLWRPRNGINAFIFLVCKAQNRERWCYELVFFRCIVAGIVKQQRIYIIKSRWWHRVPWLSLSPSITTGRFSSLHLKATQSWWMWVFIGWKILRRPWEELHKRILLMYWSSLLRFVHRISCSSYLNALWHEK